MKIIKPDCLGCAEAICDECAPWWFVVDRRSAARLGLHDGDDVHGATAVVTDAPWPTGSYVRSQTRPQA